MEIKENFLTTGIGSLPYKDEIVAVKQILKSFDVPFWPQLPQKGFKENMYVQFAYGFPGICIDEENRRVYVDTKQDLSEALGRLYEAYLKEDYKGFGLFPDYASGFQRFIDGVREAGLSFDYVKGQVTGPISLGLSVCDENGRSILYNDILKGALIKHIEMKALWQFEELKAISKNVIIFIDEPYLSSIGSSFVAVDKNDISTMLGYIVERVHQKAGVVGIHCCGNTDWSLLLETGIDIISLDAYFYSEGLLLYPDLIKDFLKRGGSIAWGIIPTSDAVLKEDALSLFIRLKENILTLEKKGIPQNLVVSNSMLTPSCGLGTLSSGLAETIISRLLEVAQLAKKL